MGLQGHGNTQQIFSLEPPIYVLNPDPLEMFHLYLCVYLYMCVGGGQQDRKRVFPIFPFSMIFSSYFNIISPDMFVWCN